MTIHISIDTGCNLGCDYCYEEPDREQRGEHIRGKYDLDAIMSRLESWKDKHAETPGLHGGEPLLIPIDDLRKIFSFINENWDGNPHIQTNGTLVTDEHIELFREHNVEVGVSCDGPDELNSLRQARGEMEDGSPTDITDKMTKETTTAIHDMADAGIPVGIITVLHEVNAGSDQRLARLHRWMDRLNRKGISGHFNPAIPYEGIQQDKSLHPKRLKEVYLQTWEWMKERPYRKWDPMSSYVDNLLGNGLTNCVNNKCDVHNAGAAKITRGDGETTGCGKTWGAVGDGVPFLQGDSTGNEYGEGEERYEMLKQVPGGPGTPQEEDQGGCKGCKYWNVCQGGCPSSALDEDYRNRTRWCEAKYALYERVEKDMRAIFPNIRLITDLPWNAEVSDYSSSWQLDIKPFGAMRPDVEGRSAASGGAQHPFGRPTDMLPEEAQPDRSWDEIKQEYIDKYPEEHLTFDEESGNIHADSER